MSKPKRLMVMAGGTGGHIFPGLTVARYLMRRGWKLRWLGTTDHMEADLVLKYGIEIDFICISGLRGKKSKMLILALIQIFSAWMQARAIMKRFQPDVVLGMGGYVSGPGGAAAWSLGIPVIIHEQNSIAGLTNKWLAKISTEVMQAFPGAFPGATIVGNPVRIDLLKLPIPQKRLIGRTGKIRVLVTGGSQGAHILNQIMPLAAEKLSNAFVIWHQSGKGSEELVQYAYMKSGQEQYRVIDFIDNMAEAYSWADVVVCRSGALTVSEIAAVGLPAIFIPFQHKDRQQYWNALHLEKVGAAKILDQSQLTADAIANILMSWNRQILLEMAKRARAVAIPDATKKVANKVILAATKN